jgi:hypothetical protein
LRHHRRAHPVILNTGVRYVWYYRQYSASSENAFFQRGKSTTQQFISESNRNVLVGIEAHICGITNR